MNKLLFLLLFALSTYIEVNGQNGHYDPIIIIDPSLSSEHRSQYRQDHIRSEQYRRENEAMNSQGVREAPALKYERHDRFMHLFQNDSSAMMVTRPSDPEDHQLTNTSVYTRNMSADTLNYIPKR